MYIMELFCPSQEGNKTNQILQGYNINSSINSSIGMNLKEDSLPGGNVPDFWDYGDFTRKFAVPSLCAFGTVGNVLNILILSKRIREGKHFVCNPSKILTLEKETLEVRPSCAKVVNETDTLTAILFQLSK